MANMIIISVAFPRWEQLWEIKGFKDDAMVTMFLLDR